MKAATTPDKREALKRLVAEVADVPGCAAEAGVYQGASLRVIAQACPTRLVYGFDTFDGLPAQAWAEGEPHKPGDFGDNSLDVVMAHTLDLPNVALVPGYFPQSAVERGLGDDRYAFVHLDLDFYRSTIEALHWFLPRMSPGGMIVFDDFNWKWCPGVAQAIAETGLNVHITAPFQAVYRVPKC